MRNLFVLERFHMGNLDQLKMVLSLDNPRISLLDLIIQKIVYSYGVARSCS